jgi:hypothetical protein
MLPLIPQVIIAFAAILLQTRLDATAVRDLESEGLTVTHGRELSDISRCNRPDECARCVLATITGLESIGPILNVESPLVCDDEYGRTKRHALGPVALAAIGRLPSIRSLYIGETTVRDEQLALIARIRTIRDLDLGGTEVTNDGLRAVAGLTHLKWLRLRATRVTDQGIAHLTNLGELEYLDLSNCAISDDGLRKLKSIRSLRLLGLAHTRFTAQGLMEFEANMRSVGIDLR